MCKQLPSDRLVTVIAECLLDLRCLLVVNKCIHNLPHIRFHLGRHRLGFRDDFFQFVFCDICAVLEE